MTAVGWTLAVDPGLRACGCSLFEGNTLYRAWLAKSPVRQDRGPKAWFKMAETVLHDFVRMAPSRGRILHRLVLEVPQVYWGRNKGGRASDLIELAGVVGSVASSVPVLERVHYLPREWKGQVPKEVHNDRVLKKLRSEERARVINSPPSVMHNVVDSIGLGFKCLGRM